MPTASTGPLSWDDVAANQIMCSETQAVLSSSSLQLQQITIQTAEVWCDLSTGSIRPLIPGSHRRAVFKHVHHLSHAGTRATTRLVSSRFVWPRLAADIKEWCRECTACQRAKVTSQPATQVEKMEIPQKRFSHVHVDLVGPLPMSCAGHCYLLTTIDHSTRWFEAVPLADISAETVLEAFISCWVAPFGVPKCFTSHGGGAVHIRTWSSWCDDLQVEHITTTAFHPQSKRMLERLHRQIKDPLRAIGAVTEWESHLLWVLLGLRTAPKEESESSTAEEARLHCFKFPKTFQPYGVVSRFLTAIGCNISGVFLPPFPWTF